MSFYSVQSDKQDAYQWAEQHNLKVKSIEVHWTQCIYEVDMTNGEKWWCRKGFFSDDWEKAK